jgi:hypothetical protein
LFSRDVKNRSELKDKRILHFLGNIITQKEEIVRLFSRDVKNRSELKDKRILHFLGNIIGTMNS